MILGAVHSDDMVNGLYRIVLPMMALERRGHQVLQVVQKRGERIPIAQLGQCDFVHMHRPFLSDDDCVERLLDAGVPVGLDDDDNMVAAPPELEQYVQEGSLEVGKREFDEILRRVPLVDLITTPGPGIADHFQDVGAQNVQLIDNYLPPEFSQVRPQGHEGVVIGWHAANEHHLDIEPLQLDEVLHAILEEHPDVHVVTMCVDLGIEHERYHREESVRFDRLTQRLADVDIGIVPLADTAFNRSRSNVKAREFAAAGVPWLASPVGAYEDLGRDEGGELVEDGEWYDVLDELIRSRRPRAKQAKRARAWAQRETIVHRASIWEEAFLEAIDARAAA